MSWLIFIAGSISGGVLSALSRRNRDSVLLRLLSFVVPAVCSVLFWYLEYKSGRLLSGVLDFSNIGSEIVNIVITTAVCTLLSKGIGWLIVKYVEMKRG